MRRALFAAAALGALALLVPAAAHAYYLQDADVAVRVAPNGALLVAERITIGGAYHGAYRDIPLRKGESIDRIRVSEGGTRYTRGGSTKLGSIDRSDTFNYEINGKRVRIVWHFLAAGEPHTYTIAYRFKGLTVVHDDVVDVNLRVWGQNWSASLANLTASVRLPRPAPLGPAYRVYGHPAWVNGVVARTRPSATLRAVNVPEPPVGRDARRLPAATAHVDLGREGGSGQGPGVDHRRGGGRGRRVPARPGAARRRQEPPGSDDPLSLRPRRRAGARGHAPGLAPVRTRAQDRLRPRVRAGAAHRHRARPRPAAPAADDRRRLAGVHRHALRPDPPRPLHDPRPSTRRRRPGAACATRPSPTSC